MNGMTRPLTKVQHTVRLLEQRAEAGVTWRELTFPHGTASRVLSDLHRKGTAVRLTEQRDGCSVYVLPEHVRGRDVLPQGRVTLSDQALAQSIGEADTVRRRVTEVLERYGLAESRFPTMRMLDAELRGAIDRGDLLDPSTLPLSGD